MLCLALNWDILENEFANGVLPIVRLRPSVAGRNRLYFERIPIGSAIVLKPFKPCVLLSFEGPWAPSVAADPRVTQLPDFPSRCRLAARRLMQHHDAISVMALQAIAGFAQIGHVRFATGDVELYQTEPAVP